MTSFSPHIAVGVRDYKQALEFYQQVLGMEMKSFDEAESELKLGDISYHIENNPSEQVTWLEFRVENVEEIRAKLEKSGCTLTRTHLEKSYLVADPFGMHFHVYEY